MAIAARSEKPDHPVSLRDSLPSSTGRGFGTHAFFVSASGFQPRAREFPRSARASLDGLPASPIYHFKRDAMKRFTSSGRHACARHRSVVNRENAPRCAFKRRALTQQS
jgi:hypothetical protein